jgi:CO/xanthine dehydrogenase FAD-binding subunit
MVMGGLQGFEYAEPTSLEEAFTILGRNEGARILAGGTDLVLGMRERKFEPRVVVNIKRIPGLDRMKIEDHGGLRIGALVTMNAIDSSDRVRTAFPMLASAAHSLGSYQIRNRATVGGNLCNASPAADTAPPLIALGAVAKIAGPREKRVIKLEDFFVGPGKTALSKDEILVEIDVPSPPRGSYGAYLKHGPRNAMDIATVNAALMCTLSGYKCEDAKIVLGSVAPTPIRAQMAEAAIRGKPIDENTVKRAAELASEECSPISDVRASAEYRRAMVKAVVRRLFRNALQSKLVKREA